MHQAIEEFRNSASAIQKRFQKEQLDQFFGAGIQSKLLSEIVKNSNSFWNGMMRLEQSDMDALSNEDASLLRTLVNQVATLDEDLNDPNRLGYVPGEYNTVAAKLQRVGLSS